MVWLILILILYFVVGIPIGWKFLIKEEKERFDSSPEVVDIYLAELILFVLFWPLILLDQAAKAVCYSKPIAWFFDKRFEVKVKNKENKKNEL